MSSSEEDEEDDDERQHLWRSQATGTWRSGEMPQEEEVASPMINQWRSRNEGLDTSFSDRDSSFEDHDEPFHNCKYNDCPTVEGCTPMKCALEPVQHQFDISNSSSEVNMELWESNDTEDNLSLSLLEVHEEQDQIVLNLSHEDEAINSITLLDNELIVKALADEGCHNVSNALGDANEKLDKLDLKIKNPDSVEKYIDLRVCPDTGASVSLLISKMAKRLNLPLYKYKGKCTVANNQIMDTLGQTFAMCKVGNRTKIVRFLVAKEVCERVLIGRQALIDLGIISRNFPEQLSKKRRLEEEPHPMITRSKSKAAKRKLPNVDDIPEPERLLRKRIKKFYQDESINVTRLTEKKKQKVTEEDFN